MCNRDAGNTITLNEDGTYVFQYHGYDGEQHTAQGHWELHQGGGTRPPSSWWTTTIRVLPQTNPGEATR
jgi:hypothetical protein